MSLPHMALIQGSSELKKGSAELLILSLVQDQARHGYDIAKLIELRSAGELKFHAASLYPLLYRLEKRGWIEGRWVEKPARGAVACTASPTRVEQFWQRSRIAGGHSCWRSIA